MKERYWVLALSTCGLLAGAQAAQAGDIYRCEGDGSKSLVDSPVRCPSGRAVRIGSSGTAARPQASTPAEPSSEVPERPTRVQKLVKRTPPSEESRDLAPPALRAHSGSSSPPPVVAVPPVPVPIANAASVCAPLRHEATALRKCLREERRKEVRIIATGRLVQISAAASELANSTKTNDGLLAVGRNGRPTNWCENLLGDLIARRNLEVIDDETVPGPAWINAGNGVRTPLSGEILDARYTELSAPSGLVANGYVTLRWQQQRTVVVRTRVGCFQANPGSTAAACGQLRYLGIDVHDDEMPQACNIGFYGRPNWPQWRDKNVEIRIPTH